LSGSIFKHISLLIGSQLGQKIVGFFALIYYARILTVEQLAVIPLFAIISELSIVLFGFGIQAYVFKELPLKLEHETESAVGIIKKSLMISFYAGGAMALIIYATVINVDEFLGMKNFTANELYYFLIGVVFECVTIMQQRILAAVTMFKTLSLIGIIKSVIRPIMLITLYYYNGITGFMFGIMISSIMNYGVTRYALRKYLNKKISYKSITAGAIFVNSWPYFLESLVMFMRRQGDQILVSSILGTGMLGVYFVAKRYADLAWVIVTATDTVITPFLSKKTKSSPSQFSENFRDLFAVGIFVSVPMALAMAVMVPFYIFIMSYEKYSIAIVACVILVFRIIPDILRGVIIGRSVFVWCDPKTRFKFTLLDTVILLPLMYFGAHLGGLAGVAVAPLLASMVSGFYGVLLLSKVTQIIMPIKLSFQVVLCAFFSGLLAILATAFFADSMLSSVISLLVFVVSYLVLFINVVTFEEIEKLVQKIIPKYGAKLVRIMRIIKVKHV